MAVEKRVTTLERLVEKIAISQLNLQASLQRLSDEMKEFKDEMKEFKDEMKEFKDEMKEFKDEMKEFKDEMKEFKIEINKKWGELANKMGTFAEDIVVPCLPTIAKQYFECTEIQGTITRAVKTLDGGQTYKEFDGIVICKDKVLLNETKVSPRTDHIERFAKFIRSGAFFDYFPELRGKELIPIFSSLSIPEHVVKHLTKKQIYALAMKGDHMDLLNFEEISQ